MKDIMQPQDQLDGGDLAAVEGGDEVLDFLEDAPPADAVAAPWKILVIDDEPDIFHATAFALQDAEIDGRRVLLQQALSATEARQMIQAEPEFAVLLLDVVMESPDAGLRLVEWVRALPDRNALRIILRTGQPGYAPELDVIRRYDINDYKTKSELTQTRLLTSLTVAIRGYYQLKRIEAHQRGLEKVVAASGSLLTERGSLQTFADGVLTQICTIADGHADGAIIIRAGQQSSSPHRGTANIVAAAGAFTNLVGQSTSRLPPDVREALELVQDRRVAAVGQHSVVVVQASDGDELLVVFSTARPLDDVAKRLLALFAMNIALAFDGIKVFRELEHFAHHDRETGLLNRAGLNNRLQAKGMSFGQLSVGELQELRGALGEAVAQRALSDIGRRLVELIRDDGLVARIQGDRLVLALSQPVDPPLVRELLETLSRPIMVGTMALQLPMALGWSHEAGTVDEGIDEAGLVATQLPIGRRLRDGTFSKALREQVRARIALLSDFPQALLDDRIDMYLQPQVRLSDLSLAGYEALVRWRMPDGRIVMPNDFIPLLEHTGAVVALGQRMIEKAVAHLLKRNDPGMRISVNISVRQLEDPDFTDWLINYCQVQAIVLPGLRLEITESAFALDGDQVGQALARLTEAGFELSIDDFGTGQSSLGRLAEIQMVELKLDRSLVSGIEHDSRARRVAGLITELGRDLGVDVLAEGIETEGQLAVLRELGCAMGQGWLFGRPAPADQVQG